jgi:LmbE family N-acetylglucosaminyl deacetylase
VSGAPTTGVIVERAVEGRPHEGKTLAVVTPHLDDMPIFAAGTVAKLIGEGYRGFLVRTSNDEVDSVGLTVGETVAANERDARDVARVLGLDGVFDLNERNHRMDESSKLELRARLIFLFRLLRVDTVFSYDPWAHDEENPDHYITAQAVEAACWMAGNHLDYEEHFAAGLAPKAVREKYYFSRRRHEINRAVDIGGTIDVKVDAICACRTQLAHTVSDLRAHLRSRGLRASGLEGDEAAAIRLYAEGVTRERDAAVGALHGIGYAEEFHWIGPETPMPIEPDPLAAFVARHAEPATD